jgi:hypothetical protein
MNLPLFDIPMQKGAGTTTSRPVDAGDAHSELRASSDHAVIAPPQGLSRSATDGVRRASGGETPRFDVFQDAAVLGRDRTQSGTNTHGKTGNLRSQEPTGERPDTSSRTTRELANGQDADAQPPHPQPHQTDVQRVITHRYGTFLHLREGGLPPREFRVVELHDGRLFDEYLDIGQRETSRFSARDLEHGLTTAKFREVPV